MTLFESSALDLIEFKPAYIFVPRIQRLRLESFFFVCLTLAERKEKELVQLLSFNSWRLQISFLFVRLGIKSNVYNAKWKLSWSLRETRLSKQITKIHHAKCILDSWYLYLPSCGIHWLT